MKSILGRKAWVSLNVLTVESLRFAVGVYDLIRLWAKLKKLQRSLNVLADKGESTSVLATACYLLFNLLNCKEKQNFNFMNFLSIANFLITYRTALAVLVELQTTPLNFSRSLFPTSPSVLQSLCYKRFPH
jgi:hypothetical protein